MLNTIFRSGQPTRLNACVGNNGFVNYFDYAEGFSLAAKALLDKVIEDNGIQTSPDYIIYPICFNMRHSIELRLKGAIEELIKVAEIANKKLEHDKYSICTQSGRVNIIYVHNIKAIWDFFKKNALELDERYKYIIASFEKHINDIANIDPTGQTFRYPISKASKKHLVDIGGLISCQVLRNEFEELHNNLEKLFYFTHDILDEYQLSSVNDAISRSTLKLIAIEFSNIKSSDDFKETKILARKRFNISPRKLDSALERIKSHYEFAPIVGEKKPLLGISEQQLIEVLRHWVMQNRQIFESSKVSLSWNDSTTVNKFEKISSESKRKLSVLCELKETLSIEYAAGLGALFYFSRDGIDYSERYSDLYMSDLKSQEATLTFSHVFEKSTLLENVLVSLRYLGFEILAEKIIDDFDLATSKLQISKIKDTSYYYKNLLIFEYTQRYMEETKG
ncbi:hypothetical protein [Paraglaciecola sp. MB-3u-78]|uniref:hypothetical protein n=1 Tax=Paraglaciecola sp. MB-3u-78 TaxID=2058332 RepID=UPI000C31BD7F|nr:hypothetical protein [Paraglaciecola sp. MB-3u-78]PKG96881.1 hypothetical protein CXF95_22515 [Paraglaciecola sp. MB-3u-78]